MVGVDKGERQEENVANGGFVIDLVSWSDSRFEKNSSEGRLAGGSER